MTIECRETRFGRPVGEPKPVEPGTKDWLWLKYAYGKFVGQSIRVDGPYRVTVAFISTLLDEPLPRVYVRDEINELNLQTSPTVKFSDLFLWRRRHYSYKEDNK